MRGVLAVSADRKLSTSLTDSQIKWTNSCIEVSQLFSSTKTILKRTNRSHMHTISCHLYIVMYKPNSLIHATPEKFHWIGVNGQDDMLRHVLFHSFTSPAECGVSVHMLATPHPPNSALNAWSCAGQFTDLEISDFITFAGRRKYSLEGQCNLNPLTLWPLLCMRWIQITRPIVALCPAEDTSLPISLPVSCPELGWPQYISLISSRKNWWQKIKSFYIFSQTPHHWEHSPGTWGSFRRTASVISCHL